MAKMRYNSIKNTWAVHFTLKSAFNNEVNDVQLIAIINYNNNAFIIITYYYVCSVLSVLWDQQVRTFIND